VSENAPIRTLRPFHLVDGVNLLRGDYKQSEYGQVISR
jgi:hypothetical protein